jgi:hypothetical protein
MANSGGNALARKSGRFNDVASLTDKQERFVVLFVANGGKRINAARGAGYADPDTEGTRLLKLLHVTAAIHIERQRRISELSTAGLGLIGQIIDGTEPAAAGVKLDAAKFVIGLAGHSAKQAAEAPKTGDKPLEEMTIEEMEAMLRRSEQALAQAQVIDGDATAPDTAPDGAQAIDITP